MFLVFLTWIAFIIQQVNTYDDVSFDGTQYISSALISSPLHRETNELGITFRTTQASCILFFASGVKGDYIALELLRGKIRFVANSDGMESYTAPAIDIIHGSADDNYADGEYHQVNVEIGIFTRIYTYTFPYGESVATVANSTAKDLRFDLDEISYFMGVPISEKARTANVLKSRKNFHGCLSSITFNEQKVDLDPVFFQKTKRVSFHGKFNRSCSINRPKYLKSFKNSRQKLSIFSHVNKDVFRVNFHYRTFGQNGMLLRSVSQDPNLTSITLRIVKNNLILNVNITNLPIIKFEHWDTFANDGSWKRIYIEISSRHLKFSVDKQSYSYQFHEEIKQKFPNVITFGGNFRKSLGFIGCVKDIYTGTKLVLVNNILGLSRSIEYTEKSCRIKDLCFLNNPCQNRGQCLQDFDNVKCNCTGTGFRGKNCEIKTESPFLKSCEEYFHAGYRQNGYYYIKPGNSLPFKVRCEMNKTTGPVTILESILRNSTYVFTGSDHDTQFYYYPVYYKASKVQIDELISQSLHCQQKVQYNCYQSTFLNTRSGADRTEFGIRWYSRHGFKQYGLHTNQAGKRMCSCGETNTCFKKDLLCNCDAMERNLRTDEGIITEKKNLPVSKIRVSITMTNHRSFFHVGHLICQSRSSLDNTVEDTGTNNDISNHVRNFEIFKNVSYTIGFNNKTQIEIDKKTEELLVIDRRLLYLIIAIVVLFTILLLCLLVFKRYIPCFCCKFYNNQAKPQIIEIYKDEYYGDRHKDYIEESFEYDVGEFAREIEFNTNSNSSSLSTVDASRYFSPHDSSDDDHCSLISSKSTTSIPTKSILKIKKELPPAMSLTKQQKQQKQMLRQLHEQVSNQNQPQGKISNQNQPQGKISNQNQPQGKLTNQNQSQEHIFNQNRYVEKEIESDQNKNNLENKYENNKHLSVSESYLRTFDDETPSPPTRKCYRQDSKNSKESLNRFRNQEQGGFPLKQKILELSTNTNNIKIENNINQSPPSVSSVSLTSSKESYEEDGMDESTPLQRLRSKSVRFSDGDDVTNFSIKPNLKTKEDINNSETTRFLYNERQTQMGDDRTQTFC